MRQVEKSWDIKKTRRNKMRQDKMPGVKSREEMRPNKTRKDKLSIEETKWGKTIWDQVRQEMRQDKKKQAKHWREEKPQVEHRRNEKTKFEHRRVEMRWWHKTCSNNNG